MNQDMVQDMVQDIVQDSTHSKHCIITVHTDEHMALYSLAPMYVCCLLCYMSHPDIKTH